MMQLILVHSMKEWCVCPHYSAQKTKLKTKPFSSLDSSACQLQLVLWRIESFDPLNHVCRVVSWGYAFFDVIIQGNCNANLSVNWCSRIKCSVWRPQQKCARDHSIYNVLFFINHLSFALCEFLHNSSNCWVGLRISIAFFISVSIIMGENRRRRRRIN